MLGDYSEGIGNGATEKKCTNHKTDSKAECDVYLAVQIVFSILFIALGKSIRRAVVLAEQK